MDIEQEVTKLKKLKLNKLFNEQIEALEKRGAPEPIINAFREQKDFVLAKANKINFKPGNLPFLPIVPACLMRCDCCKNCKNGLEKIIDIIETPSEPYYIYDIENGKDTLNLSPDAAIKINDYSNRSTLTWTEIKMLYILTDVLQRHYVWAAGSRVGDNNIPAATDEGKMLFWPKEEKNKIYGTPSCTR